ncbi:MAG: DMT family transporter [Haloferacaceae archaeon]
MLGVLFALAFAALLGTASIFSRRGLETGSFDALLVLSLAIAAPIFLVLAALTTGFAHTPLRGAAYAAAGAVAGSVLGRSLYFVGINYLGPGKSLSISATSPLYAAVLAWLVLGERVTPLVVAGTLAIVVGIAALSRDVRTQAEAADHSLAVVLYPLTGAVFAAAAVVLRKVALTAGVAPIEAAAINMVVGLVVVAPLLATRRREALLDTDRAALRNFAVASVIMAVGFVFYFVGLRTTNASVFFPLVQTQPLFAVVLSSLFLGRLEVITRWTVAGSSVIVAGATLVVLG